MFAFDTDGPTVRTMSIESARDTDEEKPNLDEKEYESMTVSWHTNESEKVNLKINNIEDKKPSQTDQSSSFGSTEKLSRTPSNANLIWATCSVHLSTLATGCVITWSSPTLPKILGYGERIHVTAEEGTWLSSLLAFGAIIGPFIAGTVIDRIGRKWTIIANMFLYLTSWVMLAYCTSIGLLYVARILAGFGAGIVSTTAPIYTAEISPPALRGTLGSFYLLFLVLGFLTTAIVGPSYSYFTLIMVSNMAPFLCIITLLWIPESPRHLFNKGFKREAMDALSWYRGHPEEFLLRGEVDDMQASADEMKRNNGNIYGLFKNEEYLKALYYVCALAFFQQMSGINVILYYAESLFQATGSKISSSVCVIIIESVMLATAACTTLTTKIFGVRKLLLFSTIGSSVSIGVLAFYFYLQDGNFNVNSLSWLPVTTLIFFFITYDLGLAPFLSVVMSEIFPAHLKAFASSIAMSFGWFLCFVLTKYFPAVTTAMGRAFGFGIFSFFSFIGFLFVYIQLPNTDGKNFQEIQEILTGKKIKVKA